MSGGVDSSVVAARVAAAGLRAVGITLAMWSGDRELVRDRGCCSIDAIDDARRVATHLGIPHYAWNLEREFEANVIDDFLAEHRLGRTPNPCVRCNPRIKFGVLLERARAIGATHLATGHYALIGHRGTLLTLHRAVDASRDQAYVLHRLSQDQLGAAVFPLGAAVSKQAVRAEAAALGLSTAGKPESQDLCFVKSTVAEELRRRLPEAVTPGVVVDTAGRTIGTHPGLPLLTVGQRTGFSVRAGRPDARPLYVLELRVTDNAVMVGPREALERHRISAADCSWVAGRPPAAGTRCAAQLRSHGTAHRVRVRHAAGASVELRFTGGVGQVSPGQSVVLYRHDEVLGGGIIRRTA